MLASEERLPKKTYRFDSFSMLASARYNPKDLAVSEEGSTARYCLLVDKAITPP